MSSSNRTRPQAKKRNLRQYRPRMEILEDRLAPALFTVVNTDDAGPGTLRQAILDANLQANVGGPDRIEFAIPGSGVQKIRPTGALPTIVDPVVIDGYTQPGAKANAQANSNDAVLRIHLDGALAGYADGLTISAGNCVVRGLVISRFVNNGFRNGNGIVLDTKGGNVIEGCFLGTDATGLAAQPNGQAGILITNSGGNAATGLGGNLIGGVTPAARNVISGNAGKGIAIDGAASDVNTIQGNFIGVDSTGAAALGNSGIGIYVQDGEKTLIGGIIAAARNIISANSLGMQIYHSTVGTRIQGNYLGTNAAGNGALGNRDGGADIRGDFSVLGVDAAGVGMGNVISANLGAPGVLLTGNGSTIAGNIIGADATGKLRLGNAGQGIYITSAANVKIGGTTAAARNVISANGQEGISIATDAHHITVQGNHIGADIGGTLDLGNGKSTGGGIGVAILGSDNTIGGATPGAGNVIAFNYVYGVWLSHGGVRNTIRGNSIFANKSGGGGNGIGISIVGGPLSNDSGDGDAGTNNQQNHPVITSATTAGPNTIITGTLDSIGGIDYELDFYASDLADPTGYGEGQIYLGSTTVTTQPQTHLASFNVTFPVSTAGKVITATATDDIGNTSEFSTVLAAIGGSVADLAIQQSESADPVVLGNDVTYTLTVTNHGPNTAADVVLSQTLPAGVALESLQVSQGLWFVAEGNVTCGLGELAAGASATVVMTFHPSAAGAIAHTWSVSTATFDPTPGNDQITEETTVTTPSEETPHLTSFRIVPANTTIRPGEVIGLHAVEVTYSDGTVLAEPVARTFSGMLQWQSSDPSIADDLVAYTLATSTPIDFSFTLMALSVSTGMKFMTGVNPGTVTIVATDRQSGVSATTTLTVESLPPLPPPPLPAHIVSIAVTPASAEIFEGEAQLFMARALYSDGTLRDFGIPDDRVVRSFGASLRDLIWTSSNPLVAVANQNTITYLNYGSGADIVPVVEPIPNKFVGFRAGTVTITAKDPFSSVKGTATLLVKPVVVAITPTNATVVQGQTTRFAATISSSQGTMDASSRLVWTSSDATVALPGVSGFVTGLRPGTVTITGIDVLTGARATATLTVTSLFPRVTAITITPGDANITPGGHQVYGAFATLEDGSSKYFRDLPYPLLWSSSNPLVANALEALAQSSTVAAGGLLSGNFSALLSPNLLLFNIMTGLAVGDTTITARDPFTGVAGTATLHVTLAPPPLPEAPHITAISLSPTSATIAAGHDQSFNATVTWSDGVTRPNPILTWSTSDFTIAIPEAPTAPEFNTVRGVRAGTVTITVSAAPLFPVSATAVVTVTSAPLPVIVLERPLVRVRPGNLGMVQGETQDFTAIALFPDGHEEDVTRTVVWASSDPTVAVNLDPTRPNRFRALRTTPNNSVITVTATDALGSQDAAYVVVRPLHSALTVSPANATLVRGKTLDFTGTVTFADGSSAPMSSLLWTSSNLTMATNIGTTQPNRFLAVRAGEVTITARSPLGAVGTTTLHVIDEATLTGITVTPANHSIRPLQLQRFTATGVYSDGTTRDLTPLVLWDASDDVPLAIVAAITPIGGLATGGARGTAMIRATFLGVSGTTQLTVTDNPSPALESIKIEPANTSMLLGASQTFVVRGYYAGGSSALLGDGVAWSSSNEEVARIDQRGIATGIGVGTTTIRAAVAGLTASTDCKVETRKVLLSIEVTPGDPTISFHETKQFTATGRYSDESRRDITSEVFWRITDRDKQVWLVNGVATVSASGLARGIGTGEVYVTAFAANPDPPTGLLAGLNEQFRPQPLGGYTSLRVVTNTVDGPGSSVNLGEIGVTVGFDNVILKGNTAAEPIDTSEGGTLPADFVPISAVEIRSSAEFSGTIMVTMTAPASTTQADFGNLFLFHGEDGTLVNRTTSKDFGTKKISAIVNSLSPFVLAQRVERGIIVTGVVSGGPPLVRVYQASTGVEKFAFLAYSATFGGGVRVATADVSGDGVPDVITGPGPGTPARVKVFDGNSGTEIRSFLPYGAAFKGGVFVATADLNGDGRAEIITGAGAGLPRVRVFDGLLGLPMADKRGNFLAFGAAFSGGVRVAAGDVNGDLTPDIIVAAGPGGTPTVKVFNGIHGTQFSGSAGQFLAFDARFRGGVFVAAADVDGDRHDDIVAGSGSGSRVKVFSGKDRTELTSFLAFEKNLLGGVRVAAADVNGDGQADLLAAPGRGRIAMVREFDVSANEIDSFLALDSSFKGGAFVAASRKSTTPARESLTLPAPSMLMQVVKNFGFSAIEVTRKLADLYDQTSNEIAANLLRGGYSAREAIHALIIEFALTADLVAPVLRAGGYSPLESARAFIEGFGQYGTVNARQVAGWLYTGGFGAAETGQTLKSLFPDQSDIEIAVALKAARFSATQTASWLVTRIKAHRIINVLLSIGYTSGELA